MRVEIREAGTITEIRRGVIKLSGLPGCVLGQVIQFNRDARGFVIGFTDTEVLALTLGKASSLFVGQEVSVQQEPLRLGTGERLLGRIIAPLGEPLDGGDPPLIEATRPLFQEAPGIMERSPVERQLFTGIRAIDTMIPIGRGQRELIIGDRMTGKTTLALDTMLSQRLPAAPAGSAQADGRSMVCIYCNIGQSEQKLGQVTHLLHEHGFLGQTIVVAAPASREASEQFLAPYAACAIGEYFMERGQDVLVVFDDLSKHAWAYRQLSLLLERPPGREAYPGDMFYVHSQLMERAGQLSPERGGGSMTFLPICETQQGDVTGYICSNLISMTDGQIYLSSELFYEGIKPAVDVGLSVSRIGNKVQPPMLREASANFRFELLQYHELLRLTRFSGAMSESVAQRQRRGALLRRLMTQPAHQPGTFEDHTLVCYAFATGWLERLTEEGIALCLKGLASRLPPFTHEAARAQEPLTPALRAKLDAALEEALAPYLRREEPHAIRASIA